MKRTGFRWAENLSILEEMDNAETSIRAISRKHGISLKSIRLWRAQRIYVLETASTICDATSMHTFLNKQTPHQGRKPKTEQARLHKMLTMYRELCNHDHVVMLNLLADELKRMDETVVGLSLVAIR
jgi:hypothetical protein